LLRAAQVKTAQAKSRLARSTGAKSAKALAPRIPALGPAQPVALVDTAQLDLAQQGWLCLGLGQKRGDAVELLPLSPGLAAPDESAGIAALPDMAALPSLLLRRRGELREGRMAFRLGRTPALLCLRLYRLEETSRRAKVLPIGFAELWLESDAPGEDFSADAAAFLLKLCRDIPLAFTGAPPLVAFAARSGLVQPKPRRAMEFRQLLEEGPSALRLFQSVLAHCLAQVDANLQPVLADRDLEGVHQLRVALRRLRSAFDIFRSLIDPAIADPLIEEIRWLNGLLGRKRDIDVFRHETLAPLEKAMLDHAALQHLDIVMRERGAAAQQVLARALGTPRFAQVRLRLAWLAEAPAKILQEGLDEESRSRAEAPAAEFAARVLKKRRRKLRELGDRSAELETEELHRLRIRAKKLRYAIEFFRPLYGRRRTKMMAMAVARLQDCLGALNDAAVGARLIGGLIGAPEEDTAAAAITGWFAGREQAQLAQLGQAWSAYEDVKPFWKKRGEP
jgi:CHAD domain-containing protein